MKSNSLITLEELKELIAAQMTEEELIAALQLDIFDLVDILEEQIQDNREEVLKELYD